MIGHNILMKPDDVNETCCICIIDGVPIDDSICVYFKDHRIREKATEQI